MIIAVLPANQRHSRARCATVTGARVAQWPTSLMLDPYTDLTTAIASSDLTDGPGRREPCFDREPGVVPAFVAGVELADLLDSAEQQGVVPGIDAALGYLVAALPALSALHLATDCPHGVIALQRTI